MKKAAISIITLLFIFLVPTAIYLIEYSTPVRAAQESIVYNLPYPGLLPDHPLYFIKALRDKILEAMTRDNIKKAELYLLLSDKRMAMAIDLVKKGKDKQAIETATKGEKYFIKIPGLLSESKKQGVTGSSQFVDKLKLSNAKHREILENFLKDLPQGWSDSINQAIKINDEVKKALQ